MCLFAASVSPQCASFTSRVSLALLPQEMFLFPGNSYRLSNTFKTEGGKIERNLYTGVYRLQEIQRTELAVLWQVEKPSFQSRVISQSSSGLLLSNLRGSTLLGETKILTNRLLFCCFFQLPFYKLLSTEAISSVFLKSKRINLVSSSWMV